MDAGELGSRNLSVTWIELPSGAEQTLRSDEQAEQAYVVVRGARAIRAEGDSGETTSSFSSDGGSKFTVHSSGTNGDVVVDVTGAVARPGVYRLPAGARVTDAVERAGGANGGALLEAINLAARLADGQQVVVPKRGPAGAASAAGAAPGEERPISLGTATVEQL